MTSSKPDLARRNLRRAALFELAEQLRDLADPAAMAFVAAQIVGRALRVSRVGYGTIDAAGQILDVERDWAAPGAAGLNGRHRFQAYGASIESLKIGEAVIFTDVERDARTAAAADAWRALGTRSVLNLPILERGNLVAVLFVHHAQPRSWSGADIEFLRDVADRTHTAIQRSRAEAALRELAASLEKQVADRTADRNRLWQLSTDIMLVARFDGVVVTVNPAWTRVLGWTEQELIGHNLFELIHPDDIPKARRDALSLSAGRTLRRYDNRFRHKNGGYRWISWTAVPSEGLVNAVGRDFTSEKEATDALARSEARMRSVFESSYQYQGIATMDGILIDANPTSLAGVKASREDVIDKYLWETPWFTGTPGASEQIKAAIPRVAAGETVRREVALTLPTGLRAFDFSMRPLLSAAGEVMAIVLEAIELTERRAAEEQLRQAQKMEAVGQLTGGIAHDFNNLLTGISGSLEMLKIRVGKERLAEIERYITTAQGAANRAAALTQRLLAFSRRQMLDPKPTQANELIAGIKDLIQRTVGPQIIVETALAGDLWLTSCDQHQLENAVLNLCINARDAMPDGGRLGIETANMVTDAKDPLRRDLVAGDYVRICVTDTGCGMSPEIIARAFDPFFTTKPPGKGTGLGLSMIYGFVKQSEGNVTIRSVVGQGTTVTICLPRFQGVALPDAPLAAIGEMARATEGESVLVVDDEPCVRLLVKDLLEGLGYAAIEAEDGAAGLKALKSDARVDLLITDVGLPGCINGRYLADVGRDARPGLKVLFITGYAEDVAFDDESLASGMEVMTKPFSMEALGARIRRMITVEP